MSEHPPVDSVAYRGALARFASGVTIVSTRWEDVDHAMTVSAFTSASLAPPLVLVCVEKIARFHEAVLAAGTFGVSILAAESHAIATHLARRGRPLAGQLDGIPVVRGLTGSALLADGLARLECRTHSVHDGGDHTILLGEVIATDVPPLARPALVYYAGAYHAVGSAPDIEV
jgi:flavin reductase (DIM6/NTAB) family NADH-FMN oxidoreductase RutF